MAHRTLRIWASVIGLSLLLAAPAQAQSYTIAPDPFLTVLDNSGLIVVGGCVWTYAAGTTTPITTYSNNSGTVNSNPIIADTSGRYTAYLLAGTNYKFVYETACTPPAHGAVLRTADNIAGVPGAAATVDITCTAGEAISAGQAVYLSAGLGGKTAGQCYKADSANTYSSTSATVVGLAPAAIASTVPGTVRIAGSVSGLSSLATGSDYYIGTAGAITATAPTNVRKLAQADTATSVVLPLPAALANADNGVDDFRLTLTSGTPVPTTDVTGASAVTVYATPAGRGNRIALYDTAGVATVYTSTEFSIAVPATTSTLYDVFAYANGSTPTLELLAWTNDTTRATAIVLTTTGTYTKAGDLTRRYLGSMRTGLVSGQTEDSVTKRYLWNYYNRVRRHMLRQETTASWTYNTATIRQANAAAANQLDFVVGVNDVEIDAMTQVIAGNAAAAVSVVTGIGLDSTSTFSGEPGGTQTQSANNPLQVTGRYKGFAGVGKHFVSWNENVSAAGAATSFYSTGGVTGNTSGISAWIDN